jgi:hypothetical protein
MFQGHSLSPGEFRHGGFVRVEDAVEQRQLHCPRLLHKNELFPRKYPQSGGGVEFGIANPDERSHWGSQR